MKKNLFVGFIALTALTVTSCTNDEVVEAIPQKQAIEFGTYLGRDAQSRGTEETAETLKGGFGVMAYLHKGEKSDYSTPNFMNNVEVYHNGSGWTYSPAKYWPSDTDNKIDFLAYGPYSGDDNTHITVNNTTLLFNVDATVANQTDLVVATPKVALYNGDGGTYGLNASNEVEFEFKHMLSRIAFYAKAASNYSNAEIKITNISLTGNFHASGAVNLSAVSPAIEGNDTNWSTPKTYSPAVTTTALTTTLVMQNPVTDYLMVIPEAAQDLTLAVTYTLKDDMTTITNTITKTLSDQVFAAGKAYAINLAIGLSQIEFNVASFDWGSEETVAAPQF